MNQVRSVKKYINVKELYKDKYSEKVKDKYSEKVKDKYYNSNYLFKSNKTVTRESPVKIVRFRSPVIEKKYSDSGMVIKSIGTPIKMKRILSPSINKSLNFTGEHRSKSDFRKHLINEPKDYIENFLDSAIRSKQIKLSLSLITRKVEKKIKQPKKNTRRAGFLNFAESLSGWEN